MFRKNLICSAVVAATLTLASTASAFHRYGHDCWGDTPMATTSNFYLGIQTGYIKSNWNDLNPVFQAAGISTKIKDAQYASRAYAQWDYSQYLGLQLGVAYVDHASYYLRLFVNPNLNPHEVIATTYVDLCLTARIPLQNNFIYTFKFGYYYARVKNGLVVTTAPFTFEGEDINTSNLTTGIGLLYPFNNHIQGELSYQYYQGHPNVTKFVPNVSLYLVGLSYRFGN